MAKSTAFRIFISFCLLLFITGFCFAEKIKLKDGRVIEGTIISMDITGVKVETTKGIIVINNEDIESILKEEKTVRVYLKDGNQAEGRVLREDEKTIRIEYSNVEWQIKKEDIQRIETLSKTFQYSAPLPPREPERKYKVGINARAGMNGMIEEGYKNGFIFSGGLSFGIHRNIALELEVSGFRNKIKQNTEKLGKGKIVFVPIQLSLVLRVPIKKFMPYISFGVNYCINKLALEEEVYNDWGFLGFEIEEDIKNTFGFRYGVGLDFFLSQNFALNIDARYSLAQTSGTWSMKDIATGLSTSGDIDDIKLNSFILIAGIKLYF